MSIFKIIDVFLYTSLQIAKWSCIYCVMLILGNFLQMMTKWSTMEIYVGVICFVLGFYWESIWFSIKSGLNVKTWALLANLSCLTVSYWTLGWIGRLSMEAFTSYFVLSLLMTLLLSVGLQQYLMWLFVNERSLFRLFSHNHYEIDNRVIHVVEFELDGTFSTYIDVLEFEKKD